MKHLLNLSQREGIAGRRFDDRDGRCEVSLADFGGDLQEVYDLPGMGGNGPNHDYRLYVKMIDYQINIDYRKLKKAPQNQRCFSGFWPNQDGSDFLSRPPLL
jgi:hypothetical protein